MVAFSSGPTAAVDWCNATGSAERKYNCGRKRTAENIDAAEEFVFSQEDAPAPKLNRTNRASLWAQK